MASSDSIELPCEACGRGYEWRPDYVGRTAQCPCGHVFKVPRAAPRRAAVLAIAPPPLAQLAAAAVMPPPLPAMPMRSPAQVPADEPFDPDIEAGLAPGKAYDYEESYEYDTFKDRDLPLGLLAAGLILVIGQIAHIANNNALAATAAAFGVGVEVTINLATMLTGVLLAAKLASIEFGPLGPAVMKLCAIWLAPTCAGYMTAELLGGTPPVVILGWGVSIILYWSLLCYMFRLNGSQTAICVMAIWGVRFVVGMCIVAPLVAKITRL